MDPFTQRMLEKAERRSRALGISNTASAISHLPLSDCAENKIINSDNTKKVGSKNEALTTDQQQQQAKLHSVHSSNNKTKSKLQVVEKNPMDFLKVAEHESQQQQQQQGSDILSKRNVRYFSAVDKENVDLGIEINVRTYKNIDVQVQVEEEEENQLNENNDDNCNDNQDDSENNDNKLIQKQFCDADSVKKPERQQQEQPRQKTSAYLRDISRQRLDGLSALYSTASEISSPIHCTEGKFHTENNKSDVNILEMPNNNMTKRQSKHCRLEKLSALASTINEWENDVNQYNMTAACAEVVEPLLKKEQQKHIQQVEQTKIPPPKPNLSSRGRLNCTSTIVTSTTETLTTKPTSGITGVNVKTCTENKTKQLNWDPKVINSLEAQGFQRRDSSTVKVSYDFNDERQQHLQCRNKTLLGEEQSINVGEYEKTFKSKTMITTTPSTPVTPVNNPKNAHEKCTQNVERKLKANTGATSFVANRAAIFEPKVNQQQEQQQRKDPVELSVKERMKLFERNKTTGPLMPKAAFGMPAPITELMRDKAQQQLINPPLIKETADCKVRHKVAALVNSTNENRILENLRKQREEDIQLLTNRFNKQKEAFGGKQQEQEQGAILVQKQLVKGTAPVPPPPPPPPLQQSQQPLEAMSNALLQQHSTNYTKRRSTGNTMEDETKRARTCSSNQSTLCEGMLDVDSSESRDEYTDSTMTNNCCTTATMTADELGERTTNTTNLPVQKDGRPVSVTPDCVFQYQGNSQSNYNAAYETADEDSYMETDDDSNGPLNDEYTTQDTDKQQKQRQHQHVQQNENLKDTLEAVDYLREAADKNDCDKSHLSKSVVNAIYRKPLNQVQRGEDNNDAYQNSQISDVYTTTSALSFPLKSSTTTITTTTTPTALNNSNELLNVTHTSRTSPSSFMHPVKSELSVNKENNNTVTLVHTVSVYRRQQNTNSANSTPVNKVTQEEQISRLALQKFHNYDRNCNDMSYDNDDSVCHSAPTFSAKSLKFNESIPEVNEYNENDNVHTNDDHDDDDNEKNIRKVQEKIKRLLDEVCKQQQIIAQTSQALNLCASTVEFSGSTESVEGERHLLVATHRRQACLDEIQRLKVEEAIRPLGAPREKGRLTIKEITLPLRQDYIQKLRLKTISGHHLVCLVKYNEHVLATKSVATAPDLPAVKFSDVLHLHDAYADFKVTIEIYGMTAQCEVLPHEVKYHINTHKKSGIKTPKKKVLENPLVMPPEQSAAGPRAIRTPALVQYAFAIFSIKEIKRTNWTLTQVLGISPLEGTLHMKLNCELSIVVEHKGFLTMFEDVSGFGAWNRRWCCLNGSVINYWKYPEDEKVKAPIGSIDLYTCCVHKITLAPRDICARLNTMLLECQRPAEPNDKPSLVIKPNGRTTIVRHLLSADTKEEREEWCALLNKTLTLLRAWGPLSQ